MKIIFKSMTLLWCLIAGLQAMEEERSNLPDYVNRLKALPRDIKLGIYKDIVMGQCRKFNDADTLAAADVRLKVLIKDIRKNASKTFNFNFRPEVLAEYEPETFEECCQLQIFLDGKVIFLKDDPLHKVEFLIKDLPNPFRGQFDLSKCIHPTWGLMDEYFRISTGSRDVNENVLLICFNVIPLFWIKKELQKDRAQHLRDIYVDLGGNWKPNALIGQYLAWGEDDPEQFACLTGTSGNSQSAKSFRDFFINFDIGQWEFNQNVRVGLSRTDPRDTNTR